MCVTIPTTYSLPDRPKSSALRDAAGSCLEGAELSAIPVVDSFFFVWPAEDVFLVPSSDRLFVGGVPYIFGNCTGVSPFALW